MIGTLMELNKAIILTIQKATPKEKRRLKQAVLKVFRSDAGVSLTEMLVVIGIVDDYGFRNSGAHQCDANNPWLAGARK